MHMSRDLGSLAVCAGAYPQPDVFVYVRSHKTGRHQALQGLSTRVRVVVKLSESQVAVSLWQVQADDGRRGVSIESDLDTWERDFFHLKPRFLQKLLQLYIARIWRRCQVKRTSQR